MRPNYTQHRAVARSPQLQTCILFINEIIILRRGMQTKLVLVKGAKCETNLSVCDAMFIFRDVYPKKYRYAAARYTVIVPYRTLSYPTSIVSCFRASGAEYGAW